MNISDIYFIMKHYFSHRLTGRSQTGNRLVREDDVSLTTSSQRQFWEQFSNLQLLVTQHFSFHSLFSSSKTKNQQSLWTERRVPNIKEKPELEEKRPFFFFILGPWGRFKFVFDISIHQMQRNWSMFHDAHCVHKMPKGETAHMKET